MEEEKEQKRVGVAEWEARMEFLRKRSRAKNELTNDASQLILESTTSTSESAITTPPEDSSTTVQIYEGGGHINLFSMEEREGANVVGARDNLEYAIEKRQEKEEYEKKIGLLKYLGQDSGERKDESLWYCQRRSNGQPTTKTSSSTANTSNQSPAITPAENLASEQVRAQKDAARKDSLDPMNTVNKSLKRCHDKEKHKKHKKRKHRSPSPASSSSSIEKLRAERLQRERIERERADCLITGRQPTQTAQQLDDVAVATGKQRYNNQFNPHLAK